MIFTTRVSPDFIHFSSVELVDDVLPILQALRTTYIVVSQVTLSGATCYYLFYYEDLLRQLQNRLPGFLVSLNESLDLSNMLPATITSPELVPWAGNGDVVVDRDTVVGVVGTPFSLNESLRGVGQVDVIPIASEQRTQVLVEAEFPIEVVFGSKASLIVTLMSPDWALLKEALINLSVDPTQPLIVRVHAQNFALPDQRECELFIPPPQHSVSCRFELQAESLGLGQIEVHLYQGVIQVGEITITPKIVKEIVENINILNLAQPLDSWQIEPTPDLEIRVFESTLNGKGMIEFELTARPGGLLTFYHTPFSGVSIESDTRGYYRRLFQVIEHSPIIDVEDIEAIDLELRNIGQKLFYALFPKELQEIFWQYGSRIQSILVLSREPYIPWEMVLVPRNDKFPEDKFLCEQFVLTRWLVGRRPPNKIPLARLRCVIPNYHEPQLILPMADRERQLLERLASEYQFDIASIPASRLGILQALKKESFDALHFSCHGAFDEENSDTSILLLESKIVTDFSGKPREVQQKLHSVNATALSSNPNRRAPLIFLNACQTGRGAFSLTGIGGWAAEFVRAGAGVFIGSHWSIDDYAAFVFAQTFYDHLFEGQTVGTSARAARLAVKEQTGNPTWLAYTIFAHPLAVVVQD